MDKIGASGRIRRLRSTPRILSIPPHHFGTAFLTGDRAGHSIVRSRLRGADATNPSRGVSSVDLPLTGTYRRRFSSRIAHAAAARGRGSALHGPYRQSSLRAAGGLHFEGEMLAARPWLAGLTPGAGGE